MKVVDVGRQEVAAVVRRASERGADTMANRTLEVVRKMLQWAVSQGYLDANPARDVEPPNRLVPRTRTLSDAELRAVWQALDGVSVQACAAIRLLLLLGQREMEVVGMRWADLDLDGALWSQPPERTKAGRAVLVPLPPAAVDILRALPRKSPDQPTVFVGKPRGAQGGRPTRSIVAHAKQRLDLMMPDLAAWRIHDLRRTVRTGLSRLRVPPHIAELVLGHAVRGVQRVYDQYDYLDERREALTRWAEHLARVVGHEPSAQS